VCSSDLDIDLACRQLIFGQNKVCGLTTPEHAEAVSKAGAVYGGLIFAEKSSRYINELQALAITQQAPSLNYVGVFVNEALDNVSQLASALALSAVQLHGQEDQCYIDELKGKLPKTCQVWKAISVADTAPDLSVQAEHYVLDGKNAGSGETFNWQILSTSEQDLSTSFLAGGLGEENIEQALTTLTTHDLFGLDLNSGVESSPGVKCENKIKRIFSHIRNY
jgi:indole-3-glycerol phosphate synthase/phosphoribosylanthranilate isomerase